jgi:hypothetical protein
MDPDAKLSNQAFISDASTDSIVTSKIALVEDMLVSDLEIPNILPDR